MNEEIDIYNNALIEIENTSKEIEDELNYHIDIQNVMDVPSTLDKLDYCYVFLFGMMGALLSTNGKLRKYLANIHNAASKVGGKDKYDDFQILMGNLLEHHGDSIDDNIKELGPAFHRVLYGHDILSVSEDNPFLLMINQKKSIIGGIFQAFRHLLADTMSRQGLPIPGSSWLGYIDENGKKTNYLIELSKSLSKDSKVNTASIYRNLFTIKATDMLGGTLAKILTESYFQVRKVEDNIRKSQISFMVYAITFFTEAIIGASKHKGVPYINIPVGAMMITSFTKFCYFNFKEAYQLSNRTEELLAKSDKLIEKYELQLKEFNAFDSSDELIDNLSQVDSNMDALIDYLGENENEENN